MVKSKKQSRRGRPKKIDQRHIIDVTPVVEQSSLDKYFSKINLAESYVSLIVGIIVVVFAAVLVVAFMKQKNQVSFGRQEISSQKTQEQTEKKKDPGSHTVAEGEDLKTISKKYYGSEEYYMELANANKIENPDIIEIGQKIQIPHIETKTPAIDKITGNTYTVKENEYLWDIAVKAYGDGFRWVDIAKLNNLEFPDVIPPGTVLKIPR